MKIKNNIMAVFEETVLNMIKVEPIPDIEVRGRSIEELNNACIKRTGNPLPSYLLLILTDWYLSETLKDKDVDKVSNNEFAILSNRQLKRRYTRECAVGNDNIDYLDQRFTKNKDSLAKKITKEYEQC